MPKKAGATGDLETLVRYRLNCSTRVPLEVLNLVLSTVKIVCGLHATARMCPLDY
jgi:hypothetical protein